MNRRKAHIIAQNGNSNSLFRRGLLAYVVSRSKYSKIQTHTLELIRTHTSTHTHIHYIYTHLSQKKHLILYEKF